MRSIPTQALAPELVLMVSLQHQWTSQFYSEHHTHTPASLHRGVCDPRASHQDTDKLVPATGTWQRAFLLHDSSYAKCIEEAGVGVSSAPFLSSLAELGPGETGGCLSPKGGNDLLCPSNLSS